MYSVKFTPTKKAISLSSSPSFSCTYWAERSFFISRFSEIRFHPRFSFFGCHVLPILRGLRKYVFEFTAASRLLRGSSSGFVRKRQPGSLIGIPGRLYPIFKPF